MTIHLLNAAVMPHRGIYELDEMRIDEFIEAVQAAAASGLLQHWIGYEETLRLVEDLCDVDLGEINVGETKLCDGDTFLVVKLRRRTVARDRKSTRVRTVHAGEGGARMNVLDYVFYEGTYIEI